jgi:hypothetical protein
MVTAGYGTKGGPGTQGFVSGWVHELDTHSGCNGTF